MRWLTLLAIILSISSCSFRNSDEGEHEKAVLPDIVLTSVEYTLGQSGENPIYITAREMTLYSADNLAIVEDISFVSYDDEGNASLEGSARHGEIATDTRTMSLEGNVRLRTTSGDMMIEADSLVFDSENDEVEADGHVRVSSEDGTFQGTGFRGDLREEVYSFRTIGEGVFDL